MLDAQFASDHDAQLCLCCAPARPPGAPATCCKTPPAWGLCGGRHARPPGAAPPARRPAARAHPGYDTQAALADDPDQSAIRDISLSLDIGPGARTEQPFACLREVGAALAEAMDGVLCDQNGQHRLPAMAMGTHCGRPGTAGT